MFLSVVSDRLVNQDSIRQGQRLCIPQGLTLPPDGPAATCSRGRDTRLKIAQKARITLAVVLIARLVLALIDAPPTWGYGPGGTFGIILVIIILLVLTENL